MGLDPVGPARAEQAGGGPEVELGRVRRGLRRRRGLCRTPGQPGGERIRAAHRQPPVRGEPGQLALPKIHQQEPGPGPQLPQQWLQPGALAEALPGLDQGGTVGQHGDDGLGPGRLVASGGKGLAAVLPGEAPRQPVEAGDAYRQIGLLQGPADLQEQPLQGLGPRGLAVAPEPDLAREGAAVLDQARLARGLGGGGDRGLRVQGAVRVLADIAIDGPDQLPTGGGGQEQVAPHRERRQAAPRGRVAAGTRIERGEPTARCGAEPPGGDADQCQRQQAPAECDPGAVIGHGDPGPDFSDRVRG